MSRKKKVFVLIHLCFSFTYLCWLLIQPHVHSVFSKKTYQALYTMVHDEQPALFQALSEEDQRFLKTDFSPAQKKIEIPPFALAWLFFSLAICLLLLFSIEGASLAAWLLPVIALGYGYSLYLSPKPPLPSLFPQENTVLERYVPEKQNLKNRKALVLGWHRYLISEWTHETPSSDPAHFQIQVNKGLFAFNVARLKWILSGKEEHGILNAPPSFLRVALYLFWNLIFAWNINRKEKTSLSAAPSLQNS